MTTILWAIFALALLTGTNGEQLSASCQAAEAYGVNLNSFPINAGHLAHSITVEDIRFFFDEGFPINNSIPTVNSDLTGDHLLDHAPSRPSDFEFPAGAAFDIILNNNDDPSKFMWNGLTTLEKIAHQNHMMEVWHKSGKLFQELNLDEDEISAICPCLTDEANNGILASLEGFAEVVRLPVKRGKANKKPSKASYWVTNSRRSSCYWCYYWRVIAVRGIGNAPKGETVPPKLKKSPNWPQWMEFLSRTLDDQLAADFALYMYCKINM